MSGRLQVPNRRIVTFGNSAGDKNGDQRRYERDRKDESRDQ